MSDQAQTIRVRMSQSGEAYSYSLDDGITWSGQRFTRLQPLPGGYTISFDEPRQSVGAPLPLPLPEFTRALLSRP